MLEQFLAVFSRTGQHSHGQQTRLIRSPLALYVEDGTAVYQGQLLDDDVLVKLFVALLKKGSGKEGGGVLK